VTSLAASYSGKACGVARPRPAAVAESSTCGRGGKAVGLISILDGGQVISCQNSTLNAPTMFVVSTVSDVKTLPTCIAYKALKATTENVTWVLGARGRSGEVRHSPLPEFLLFFLRVHLLLPCAPNVF